MTNPTPSPPRPGPAAQEGISEERLADEMNALTMYGCLCRTGQDASKEFDILTSALRELQRLRRQTQSAGELSSVKCECCNGTRLGPVNSNFAGMPCPVCKAQD